MRQHFFSLVLGSCALFTSACAPVGETGLALDELDPVQIEEDEAFVPDGPPSHSDPTRVDLRSDLPDVPCTATPPLADAVEIDDPEDPRGGLLLTRDGDRWLGLPLRNTTFDTVVVGTVAETMVTQTFENTLDHPIEVVYTFPLPRKGAVDDYWMRIDDRFIRGVLERRDAARKIYEAAKQEGKTAGLLEQERPNIFTQSVANIPPGASILVGTHVVQPLDLDDGRYRLVLPTVVGPRFIPGTPTGSTGTGVAADTDRVPDASRITPPVLPEGFRTCSDLEIGVTIDAGAPVDDLRSEAHRVTVDRDEHTSSIALDESYALLNRDFELSWRTTGGVPRASLLTEPGQGETFFTLAVQPPRIVSDEAVVGRELVFVLDASGSMHGAPMEAAKDTVRKFLHGMHSDDAFTVIRFSDRASGLGETLLENTPHNVERALAYVDELVGQGGTMMTEGIRAALSLPGDPDRVRTVIFLTDGYIGNEIEISALIEEKIGRARLFSLGVGAAPNRHLLDTMALVGRGSVEYVGLDEKPEPIVNRFYEQLSNPTLTDIEIDFGDLDVRDVVPRRIPDLFEGRPVVVFGKVRGKLDGTVAVRGQRGGQEVEIPVDLHQARTDTFAGLGSMWARRRIAEILLDPARLRAPASVAERTEARVVDLSLKHRVLTEYTAFVAVDSEARVDGSGTLETVVQTTDLVEGMAHSYVYGHVAPVPGSEVGLGGLGLTGRGGGGGTGSGYGRGSGAGFGGRGARIPRVRVARAKVTGSLSRHIIRRVVRAHINEVRGCYNRALVRDPSVHGRVVLRFSIGSNGTVKAASIPESQIEDSTLEQCITEAARRWSFPVVEGGGAVVVSYPFVLSPDTASGRRARDP